VKKPKYDCNTKETRARPKKTQSMMMLEEFQAHVEPANVKTTMKRTKAAAFNTAPTQSIDNNFPFMVIEGCGLYPGNSIR
jgi:hypothetical protein